MFYRPTRVQVSPPHSAPTQPSTRSVSGPGHRDAARVGASRRRHCRSGPTICRAATGCMPLNSGRPIIGRLRRPDWDSCRRPAACRWRDRSALAARRSTPQIPPPHLLTRTRASPAWVSQTPVGSPAPCARADGAASNAAAIAMMRAVLQAMNHSFEKAGLHSNKSDLCNVGLQHDFLIIGRDHLPQRVRRIDSAVPRP